MAPPRRVILLAGFSSLLTFVKASPVPISNTSTFRPRDIAGENDWLGLDSVGMMLPSTEGNSLPGMSNILHAGDGLLPRNDERRYASRDVVRRDAMFGVHKDTDESMYVLKRNADDSGAYDKQGSVGVDDDEDDNDDMDDDDDEDDDNKEEKDDEEEEEEAEEREDLDKRENHELAARHESLLKGISVLGAPTFSRRNEGWLSRLFRRKKSKSSNRSNSKQSSRKNRNRSKKNKKQRKSKSKKGKGKGKGRKNKSSSGAFDLKDLDLMKGATILTTITWYTGIDLLNPFCDRKTRWTPTDDSLIIAVTEKWSKRPSCGEFMEITTTDEKEARSVIARIVDLCGGCIPEVAHADLSKAAFRKLYDLDVGRVHGLKMRRVGAPKRWSEKLYGPRTL